MSWSRLTSTPLEVQVFIRRLNDSLKGSPSLGATLFDFLRNLLVTSLLLLIGWAADMDHPLIMALWTGCVASFSFLQSRLVTDPLLWSHLLRRFRRNKSHVTVTRDVERAFYPLKRLRVDLVVTLCLFFFAAGLTATTLFRYLHPIPFFCVAIFTAVLGFASRWLIPMLRKPSPFTMLANPVIESKEFRSFEPPDASSRVMWFEQLFRVVCSLEKVFLFPLIFLIALHHDIPLVVDKFGIWYISF